MEAQANTTDPNTTPTSLGDVECSSLKLCIWTNFNQRIWAWPVKGNTFVCIPVCCWVSFYVYHVTCRDKHFRVYFDKKEFLLYQVGGTNHDYDYISGSNSCHRG
ncbi:hypothetical protein AX774_g4004 [Zancudomyces culisetae]|uniref:Uncharacterized protein n=1 Tax=Zancudomyces culisetae TaxID=1213189 RepID=A0A1R1PNG4_ZANCU|nr:hypothetical protein AX774_g4004 [Zancudomyces culisetae]|eukprot:OMH82509.1 hypothetical protein AX774_g4004 [Zancudomyces culisetae]